MDVWKYEIISRVEHDISRLFALLTREISWSIFPHIHVLFSI